MGIYSVQLKRDGSDGDSDEKYVSNYTEVYQVLTDDPTTTLVQVANAPGIPVRYQQYPWDSNALCLNASAKPTDPSRLRWEVTAKYSTKYDQQEDQNPLLRPVKWSLDGQEFTAFPLKDLEGRPVVNSAEDAFDSPVEIDDSRAILVAVRNEALLPLSIQEMYRNAINLDRWQRYQPNRVKVMSIKSGEVQVENGYVFYSVTYTFAITFNPDGWQPQVADLGYNCLIKDGNNDLKKVRVTGDNPEFLIKHADGTVTVSRNAKGNPLPTFRTDFVFYNPIAFGGLNLNDPIPGT